MARNANLFLAGAVFLAAVACDSGRHSASGFRLPLYGDLERGKQAFISHECHRCHQVSGVDLPQRAAPPDHRILLGGEIERTITDGYLVTSIIHPTFERARYRRELIADTSGKFHMPEYADNLSVRELTDLVAFLQSRYTIRQPLPNPAYN